MSAWESRTRHSHVLGRVDLRLASESPVPFAARRVTFLVAIGGTEGAPAALQATTLSEKVKAAELALANPTSVTLLALWTGRTRTDAFLVDDLKAAAKALGIDVRTPDERREDDELGIAAAAGKRVVDAFMAAGFTRAEAVRLLADQLRGAAK